MIILQNANYFYSEVPQEEAKHRVNTGQQEGGHAYTQHVQMRVAQVNKGNSWHRQMRWVWVHSGIPQAEEGEHKPVRGRAHIHTTCTDKGGMDKQGGHGCRRIQGL